VLAALTRPNLLPVDPSRIPGDLVRHPRWLVWRLKWRINKTGEPKWTKVPYRPDGCKASSTDPETWSTFERVWLAYRRGGFDGIGIVMTADSGQVGIDLDDARDPITGAIEPWATHLMELLDSYTEASPSRTGLRIFTYGTLPAGRKKKGAIEMYSVGRYLTVTGYVLPGVRSTIEPRQAQLEQMRREVFGEAVGRKPISPSHHHSARPLANCAAQSDIEAALNYINADEREVWFNIGAALHAELGEAGRSLWDSWSQTSTKYDAEDQDRTWRGFHADGGIGIGTLFHYAREAGWPGNRPRLALVDDATGEVVGANG
jgi:hypothetical protein